MAFTRAWDETDPASSNLAKEGAQEIRELKTDVRERLNLEHVSAATDVTGGDTGMHKWRSKTIAFVDSPYTVLALDHVILCNCAGGAITVTLPAISGIAGKPYLIIKTDTTANKVTVDGSGSETINGVLTKELVQKLQGIEVTVDSAEWKSKHWESKLGYLDHGSKSGNYTIDLELAMVHLVTFTAVATLTIAAAYVYDRSLVIIKPGANAITLAGIDNASPTLTNGASKQDMLMLTKSFGKVSCVGFLANISTS